MLKRNILYFLIFACFLISALYSGEKVLFIISFAFALLPFISLVFLIVTIFRYKYVEQMDKRQAARGDIINYSLDIYNEDIFLYPFIKTNFYTDNFTTESIFDDRTFYLLPKGRYHIKKEIVCDHIGRYNIGVESFDFRDFFGFFTLSSNFCNENKEVKILPKIVELNNFKVLTSVNSESFHSSNKVGMDDYSQITEIRKYTPGQPLKNIHWKLSAKKNELMAKKFNNPQSSLTYLYVDISKLVSCERDNAPIKDIIIESAIAILKFCLKKSIPVNLCFNDINITRLKVGSRRDFDYAYNKLFQMHFDEILPIGSMFHISREYLLDSNDIIIIATDYSDDFFDKLVGLKLSGKNVTLVCPMLSDKFVDSYFTTFFKGLQRNGIHTYKISHADEIKKVLEMQ